MEDESDLRLYINVLMRHWRLIVVVTLLAGVVALAVSLLSSAKYEATATVLVTRPLYQFQFSPAIQNLADNAGAQQALTGKAAVDLANGDALLQQVLLGVGDNLPADERNLFTLRKMLKAKTGSDPSVINLSVTNRDAQRVAEIANTWATLYVRQVNDLYGKSADQFKFFEGLLTQAKNDLEAADQALLEFQKRNDLAVLQAQMTAKQSALSNYLGLNESLILLQQNVKNLQDQLARRPADSPSNLGDDLAQLMLQVSAFSAQSSSPARSQAACPSNCRCPARAACRIGRSANRPSIWLTLPRRLNPNRPRPRSKLRRCRQRSEPCRDRSKRPARKPPG